MSDRTCIWIMIVLFTVMVLGCTTLIASINYAIHNFVIEEINEVQ